MILLPWCHSPSSVLCGGRGECDFLVEDSRMSKRVNLCYMRWLPRLTTGRRWTGALLLLAVLGVGPTPPAQAGDTRTDFLPELNAYIKLTDTMRLFLLGTLTQNLSDGSTEGE